jgi:hypothetical protein
VHDSNVWVAPFGLMADFPTNIDFTGHPDLFPSEGAIVKIKMQGSRGRDFTEAFKKSGIDRKLADDYTWHHVADFDPTPGETTMQLIKTDIHKLQYLIKVLFISFKLNLELNMELLQLLIKPRLRVGLSVKTKYHDKI